jgi:hypothetical protein
MRAARALVVPRASRRGGCEMPRDLIADKLTLGRHGFNFMGTNGTVEFTVDKTLFHVSIHGEGGPPATWDKFHVKVYDLRFTKNPGGADKDKYATYIQVPIDKVDSGSIFTAMPLNPRGSRLRQGEAQSLSTRLQAVMAALPPA